MTRAKAWFDKLTTVSKIEGQRPQRKELIPNLALLASLRLSSGHAWRENNPKHLSLICDGEEMNRLNKVAVMPKIKEPISKDRLQYQVIIVLSIGVVGLAGIIYFSDNLLFQRFLGRTNPLFAFLIINSLGVVLLSFLLSRGWFAIYKKENLKRLFRFSVLAAVFASITILVDLKVVFPADMNVLFPESLLFYAAIGFLVEILFHVLPLSVLLISLTSIFKNVSSKNIIWICIFIVSLLEPVYQTALMGSSNHYPLWAVVYIGFHLFLFNLFQLLIFKRYDFISMYSFRLVYYMLWHIVWGYTRLKWLF
jgi:hypothetical protein